LNKYLRLLNTLQQQAITLPKLSTFGLHALLRAVIDRKHINSSITIHLAFGVSEKMLTGPESQLRQVFFVIFQNALDAMGGPNRTLTVRTEDVGVGARPMVVVAITDTGRGIPEHLMESVFELSTAVGSLKEKKKGSGFGLPWARAFVRTYAGDIWFDS